MTKILCDKIHCVHNDDSYGEDKCRREEIQIDEDGNCDDQEVEDANI